MKNTLGKNVIAESMYTIHIVTDEDGSLKMKQVDEFNDSKVFVEMNQAIEAAIATTAAKGINIQV